jgi:hypothetical protein
MSDIASRDHALAVSASRLQQTVVDHQHGKSTRLPLAIHQANDLLFVIRGERGRGLRKRCCDQQ